MEKVVVDIFMKIVVVDIGGPHISYEDHWAVCDEDWKSASVVDEERFCFCFF